MYTTLRSVHRFVDVEAARVRDAQSGPSADDRPRSATARSHGRLQETVERVELVRPFVETSTEGARELGRWYWSELERSTRGLVRGRVSGTEIRLVLGGSLTLLRFGRAELAVDSDDVECRFPILGGLLTSEPGGSLAIAQRESSRAPRLEIAVCGYQPSLAQRGSRFHRGLLYTALQAPLHRALSRRSLARAARSSR